MQKLRKLWYVLVAIATILLVGYQAYQMMKEDSSGPYFNSNDDLITLSIADPEETLLEGITAADKKDGDVTDSILVEKLSGLYDGNKRTVTYVAFDSDDHISKMERELQYTDYVSPRFSLSGSLRFRAGETINIDKIIGVNDCIDGDLSNKVKILMDTTINNRLPGVYDVVYEVTNSAGDTQKLPVQVEIYETNRNEIELNLKEYLVYSNGKAINYKNYLKSVKSGSIEYFFEGVSASEEDSIPKSRVTVDAKVNYKVPGVYPVYFYYENYGSVYTQGTEVMYVVVQ